MRAQIVDCVEGAIQIEYGQDQIARLDLDRRPFGDIDGFAQFDPFGHFRLLVDAFARPMLGKGQVGCGTLFRMKELAGR
jgi:hypothetical protein